MVSEGSAAVPCRYNSYHRRHSEMLRDAWYIYIRYNYTIITLGESGEGAPDRAPCLQAWSIPSELQPLCSHVSPSANDCEYSATDDSVPPSDLCGRRMP